jgi:hypothetical protein
MTMLAFGLQGPRKRKKKIHLSAVEKDKLLSMVAFGRGLNPELPLEELVLRSQQMVLPPNRRRPPKQVMASGWFTTDGPGRVQPPDVADDDQGPDAE